MKLKDGQNLYFRIAYWKKRWVAVPLFYCPDDAVTENGELARFKVTPLDGHKIESSIIKRENKGLEKASESVAETIVPYLLSKKDVKQLCSQNDIPLGWVTDRFPSKISNRSEGINRLENRKFPSITSKEFRLIRKELKKINQQTVVIINLLWYFNNVLGKAGDFVTLEEILRLQTQDISPECDVASNWISLYRSGHFVVHCLPTQLWKSLCNQINDNSAFVFSNKFGGPLSSVQIDKYIKKAAKQTGCFQFSITSLNMRPQFNKQKVERVSKKYHIDASVKSYLDPINSEKWKMICKEIPEIVNRRGRKCKYNPIDLLNAMLYLHKTHCSFRKLPYDFPPWRAVDSQFRRWKRAGIFKKVLNFLKK